MMRARGWVVCTWIAGVFLSCDASEAQTRIGVIATETAETEKVVPLVELGLTRYPSVVLVERNVIKEVLREQQLQAMLAADAPGKRAALGKMLKADLLVFLTGRDKPKPHVVVVVCETDQGLRLCSERVLLADKPEADADAIIKQIAAAASKRREKIVDVVAVPPLVNNSLTHEADNLQGGFARLVERALLRRPGVLVVELAEAKALAREMVVSSAPGIERRLPLYLMGEYRLDGAGEKRRAKFTWKLLRGEKELGRRHEEDLAVEKMPDRLYQAAISVVEKALGASPSPEDPEAEAKQLAQRARAFIELGAWQEALAMAEASLLVKPEQPETHRDALRAIIEIYLIPVRYLDSSNSRLAMHNGIIQVIPTGPLPSQEENLSKVEACRAALPHLEAFFRATRVNYAGEHAGHVGALTRWTHEVNIEELTPEMREACLALRRDMRATASRILAAKAAMGRSSLAARGTRPIPNTLGDIELRNRDMSLCLLWRWTEPPCDPPANDKFLVNLIVGPQSNHPFEESRLLWNNWLKKNLPEICANRLRLLGDFAGLADAGSIRDLITIRQDAGPQAEPVYVEFLKQVEKLPDFLMQREAKKCRESILNEPQRLKEEKDRGELRKNQAKTRPQPQPVSPPPPVKDPEVIFHPLSFQGDVLSEVPAHGERDANPYAKPLLAFPAGEGCDVFFRAGGPLMDVVSGNYTDNRISLMKQKGRLELLPLRITPSRVVLRNGVKLDVHFKSQMCWDGRYVWVLNAGEKGPLAVIEPKQAKVRTFGPESGLPPSTSCGVAPLGPGKVCLAGYFGRLWVALATFNPSTGMKLEVIHEARATPGTFDWNDNSPERHSPKLAEPITFVTTLTAPAAAGEPARQRVVVGRHGPDPFSGPGPLIVDPESKSVTSALSGCPCPSLSHGDALYWQPKLGNPNTLYRVGFPDFKKELINNAWPRSACVFFEGNFHLLGPGYYLAPGPKGPLRRLQCDMPGGRVEPDFSQVSLSNHYGLLVSTQQGVYRVELKTP